jgi:hypothetical protein
MLTIDARDALVLAKERTSHLREEAAGERLRTGSKTRQVLAALLHRAANRLQPAPVAPGTG